MKRQIILLLAIALLIAGNVVTAEQIAPYGGVLKNYTNSSGGNNIETRLNIPLTVEDVAYPWWLFALFMVLGMVLVIAAIVFISRKDNAAWISVLMCGIIALGAFEVCAFMAPLVADIKTSTDIVVGYNFSPNTIYVEQTVTYLFSPWVSWACHGAAIAGFLIFITGCLMQWKEAQRIANEVKEEKIRMAEINFRTRDRK